MISWYTFTKIPPMFCNEFQIFKITFLKLIWDSSVLFLNLDRKLEVPNLDNSKSKCSWWNIKMFSNNFDLEDQITTHKLSQLVGISHMVCYKMSWKQSYTWHHQGKNWRRKKEMNQDRLLTHSRVNGTLKG